MREQPHTRWLAIKRRIILWLDLLKVVKEWSNIWSLCLDQSKVDTEKQPLNIKSI